MAAGWAILLALGTWVAPGFAASGSDEDNDPRDEAATDAKGAAWSYLRYGSNQEPDRAEATLCEGASPELTPADLDQIRTSYSDELGGIADIDLETGDPVSSAEGITVAATVSYIYQGTQRHEDFMVTVQENDGTYCVSNATQVKDEGEQPSNGGGTEQPVDPETVATDFVRGIVVDRDAATGTAAQCTPFTGITAQDLDQAINDWAATNGAASGYLNSVEPADSPESSVTVYEIEVVLEGDLTQENFVFQVGVQGNCVASLEGGEDLMDGSED